MGHSDFDHLNLFRISDFVLRIYDLNSLLTTKITILKTSANIKSKNTVEKSVRAEAGIEIDDRLRSVNLKTKYPTIPMVKSDKNIFRKS